jgi:hypothetical protein
MSKLLARLQDAARSGVYRATRDADILEATRGSDLDVVSLDCEGNILDALARQLGFPDWFGGNWDALEDCLGDLSWRADAGRVLVFRSWAPGDELGTLVDVLRSSAEYWAGRGRPFFAVFIDPARKLALPDLYREA